MKKHLSNLIRTLFLILIVVFVSACGGDGAVQKTESLTQEENTNQMDTVVLKAEASALITESEWVAFGSVYKDRVYTRTYNEETYLYAAAKEADAGLYKAYPTEVGETYKVSAELLGADVNRDENFVANSYLTVSSSIPATEGTGVLASSEKVTDGNKTIKSFTFVATETTSYLALRSDRAWKYANMRAASLRKEGADTTAPVIALNGKASIDVIQGTVYSDQGATALDDVDGDISSNIVVSNMVDTTTLGRYHVVYDVNDSSNNEAIQVIRIVNIVPVGSIIAPLDINASEWMAFGVVYKNKVYTRKYDGDTYLYAAAGEADAGLYKTYPTEVGASYQVTAELVGADVNRDENFIANSYLTISSNIPVTAGTNILEASEKVTDGNKTIKTFTFVAIGTTSYLALRSDKAWQYANLKAVSVQKIGSVSDTVAPVITLNGNAIVDVVQGTVYMDEGASALDNVDGDISANIVVSNPVDTTTLGSYTVKYDVNDSSNNMAVEVTRTVNVIPSGGTAVTLMDINASEWTAFGVVYKNKVYTRKYNGDTYLYAAAGEADAGLYKSYSTEVNATYKVTAELLGADVNRDENFVANSYLTLSSSLPVTAGTNTFATSEKVSDGNKTTKTFTFVARGTTSYLALRSDKAWQYANLKALAFEKVNNTTPTVVEIAREIIAGYAENNNSTVPTLQDYIDAGVSGVSTTNLTAVNQAVEALTRTEVDTLAELNALVAGLNNINSVPVISLLGDSNVSIAQGMTYTDAGATANDTEDGDLTASIETTNPVDTTVAGVYTIEYDVNDSNGVSAVTVIRTVTVTEVQTDVSITGQIRNTGANVLSDIVVKVFAQNSTTALGLNILSDSNGLFSLNLAPDSNYTLQFSGDGYAIQVLPLHTPDLNQTANLDVTMIARGTVQAVSETNASDLLGESGARVIVPAGAFVTPDGTAVSDNIEVTITPVNVSTSTGVASFPGNFAGIQEGATSPSPIVSYGTVEYQFTRNGEVLQLASGQTAEIEIPIYFTTHPDGTAIALGNSIPLWSLDETTGNWSQDGNGTVVSSAQSPTGFALRATVSHFTWWNCDVTYNSGRARVTVVGTGDCTANVRGRTDAYIGWRVRNVNTFVPLNQATYPLPVPSTGATCFQADISCTDGRTATTVEVCRTIAGGTTEDITLVMPSESFKIGALPDTNLTVEIGTMTQIEVLPFSLESSVNYTILSGNLPSGIALTPKAVISGSSTKAILSGKPTEEGMFFAVIEGTDSDGNKDTVTINYTVTGDTTAPILTLNGSSYITIDKNEAYIDAGAMAFDNIDGNITSDIVVDNTVDISMAGYYTIKYNVQDTAGNSAVERTRYVTVRETDCNPVLHINLDENYYGDYQGPYLDPTTPNSSDVDVDLILGTEYMEYGANAYCSTIGTEELEVVTTGSDDVNSSKVGTYAVEYVAIDSNGNEMARATRFVHVVLPADTEAPVVTLNNEGNMTIIIGKVYTEYNATVTDNRDSNLDISITGAVDTLTLGTYYVTYTATDLAGNTGMAIRQIKVVQSPLTAFAYEDKDAFLNEALHIAGGWEYGGVGTLSFNWSDETGTNVALTQEFDYTPTVAGIHTLSFVISDNYGATASDSMDVNVTERPDSTPNQFYFADVMDVNISTVQEADVYITGINTATPISIVNGEYSLDNKATWQSGNASVMNNARVYVRHTSADALDTSVDTNLTVGGVSAIFSSRTKSSGSSAPVAEINYDTEPASVEIYGGASVYAETGGTDDLGIISCEWQDENGDLIPDTNETFEPEPNLFYHCPLTNVTLFNDTGSDVNYIYTFVVRDGNGNSDTNELNVTVHSNTVPTADIGGNRDISINSTLNITAVSDDADAEDNSSTLSYQWMYGLKGSGAMYGAGSTLDFSHTFDVAGLYTVTFRAADSHGVAVEKAIDVNVSEVDMLPVITLNNSSNITLIVGDSYVEYGAEALDNEDGNITASIVIDNSLVDTTVAGDYTVTYNVQDSVGNSAVEVIRTVHVLDAKPELLNIVAVDTTSSNPASILKLGYTFTVMTDTEAPLDPSNSSVSFYGFIEGHTDNADRVVLDVHSDYADGSQFQVVVKDSNENIVGQSAIFTKKGTGAINFGTLSIQTPKPTGFSAVEIAEALTAHNNERVEVGIAENLVWDDAIAQQAQAYADVLKANGLFEHDPKNYNPNSGLFSDYTGENLYASSSATPPLLKDAVLSWAAEKADYTYGPYGDDSTCTAGKVCGHYTQIIWKDTTRVGCGMAQYGANGIYPDGHVVVCKYKVPGNFTGQTPY